MPYSIIIKMKRGTLRQAVGLRSRSNYYRFNLHNRHLAEWRLLLFLLMVSVKVIPNTCHVRVIGISITSFRRMMANRLPRSLLLAVLLYPHQMRVPFILTIALLHVNIFDKICQNIPCTLFLNSLLTVSGINILYCLRFTISDYHSHSNATELLQQSTIKPKNAHFISIVL